MITKRTKNGEEYIIREAGLDEWDTAMELAFRVFLKYESEEYGREGTDEFASFVSDPKLKSLFEIGVYTVYVAVLGGEIIGVVSRRSGNHISLLFVDDRYHRQGVGASLLSEIVKNTIATTVYTSLTVNSSPYGEEFYHRLGFTDLGERTKTGGMIYTPMELKLRSNFVESAK